MIPVVKAALRLGERRHQARFEEAQRRPAHAQACLLERLLAANRDSVFGREHDFAGIRCHADYARRVPIRDYEGFRPYVDRIATGEQRVLTLEPTLLFTTTSGTTSLPKLIPVTASWGEEMASLTRLWMLRAANDHPACFDRRIFYLASPAVEGRTPCGLPYGALTGVLYQRLPWIVRQQYSLPYAVSILADPEARYFLTMRLALLQSISIACTPNPTSLIRLAESAQSHAEQILRAVHDGSLGIEAGATLPASGYTPERAAAEIRAMIRPDPQRARQLARIVERHGAFTPGLCWPELKLVGCWLGGSAGIHARRVQEQLGDVPLRDLGFLASEGRFSVPVEDGSPAGPLALHTSFFEFIPEQAIEEKAPLSLLAHQLEDGARYYVILSGGNGLYRYDINDVVEVQGFHERAPRIRFVRKGRDMVSITGEKLHLNQIQAAVREAELDGGFPVWQFRVIPDAAASRYDLLLESHAPPSDTESAGRAFLAAFERSLSAANIEYASKRRSRRLLPPRLYFMRRGWAERFCRSDFRSGKREAQYKWPAIRDAWDEASRGEVIGKVGDADRLV